MEKNKEFSQQQIVDCDWIDSQCNGGLMEYAYTYIQKTGGIESYVDYPYVDQVQTCKADKSKYDPDVVISGWEKMGDPDVLIARLDEEEMKEFLYENGPLGVAMNGIPLASYISGIIDLPSSECPSTGINVSLLLVGYGVDSTSGIPYWIVQNSWGETWGESGYFRIKRGSGTCGINYYVITAKVSYN